VLVPLSKCLSTLEKHVLRIPIRPPQPITIVIRAAPLTSTGMIIQNDHQPHISQCLHREVKDLHGRLADEFRVGLQVLWLDHAVVEVQLQRVGQPDAVHVEFMLDVGRNLTQRSALQSVHALSAEMSARPVAAGQLDSPALGVDYPDSVGGEGELDFFGMEQGSLFEEILDLSVVIEHEILVTCKIVAHAFVISI